MPGDKIVKVNMFFYEGQSHIKTIYSSTRIIEISINENTVIQPILNDFIALITGYYTAEIQAHGRVQHETLHLFSSICKMQNRNLGGVPGSTTDVKTLALEIKKYVDDSDTKPPNFKLTTKSGYRKIRNYIYSLTKNRLTNEEIDQFRMYIV